MSLEGMFLPTCHKLPCHRYLAGTYYLQALHRVCVCVTERRSMFTSITATSLDILASCSTVDCLSAIHTGRLS